MDVHCHGTTKRPWREAISVSSELQAPLMVEPISLQLCTTSSIVSRLLGRSSPRARSLIIGISRGHGRPLGFLVTADACATFLDSLHPFVHSSLKENFLNTSYEVLYKFRHRTDPHTTKRESLNADPFYANGKRVSHCFSHRSHN